MEKPLAEAKTYLQEVLGAMEENGLWGEPWKEAKQLPFYLQDLYTFYWAQLFGRRCLLMLSRTPAGETPAVVRKHWQAVGKKFDGDIIYLLETISSYNRKRLIEQRVPFMVPGNQLYLPTLGVDLREYFKHSKKEQKPNLGAAAQALVIREILLNDCSELPAKELAYRLGYSSMTVTRAIKELEDKKLVVADKVGREKRLLFTTSGRKLWEAALPTLQSPVKKRIWVDGHDQNRWIRAADARLAGEAAMARYTMLAGPDRDIWAISNSEWPGLKKLLNIEELDSTGFADSNQYRYSTDAVMVELWAYNPTIIENNWDDYNSKLEERIVDPLSLWLSFDNNDERIEMAREALLDQVWSRVPW